MFSITGKSGLSYSARLRDRTSNAIVGIVVTLTESPITERPGWSQYTGTSTAIEGRYWAEYLRAGAYLDREQYDCDGTQKITELVLRDRINTRSSHTASNVADAADAKIAPRFSGLSTFAVSDLPAFLLEDDYTAPPTTGAIAQAVDTAVAPRFADLSTFTVSDLPAFLLADDYVPPANALVQGLSDRLPESRTVKLDAVATADNADLFKATIPANLSTFDPVTQLVSLGKVGEVTVTSPNDFKAINFNTVTPDNAGIAKLTALLTPDFLSFTEKALENGGLLADERLYLLDIPQNPLLETGYTVPPSLADIESVVNGAEAAIIAEGVNWQTGNTIAPNNALIQALSDRLPESRTVKFDTVATIDNADSFKADITGLSTFDPSTQLVSVGKVGTTSVTGPADLKATGFATDADVETMGSQISTLFGLVSGGSFTSVALQNAPTGSGSGSGLTPEQSGILTTLRGLVDAPGEAFKATALVNAPASAGGGLLSDERTKLLGLPTDALRLSEYTAPPLLSDIVQAINESEAVVIAHGNLFWPTATGFNTLVPDNSGILNAVSAAATSINANVDTADAEIKNAIAAKSVTQPTNLTPVLDAIAGVDTGVSSLASAIAQDSSIGVTLASITAAIDGQTEQLKNMVLADKEITANSLLFLEPGTQTPLAPVKTITRNGENIEVKQQ